MPRVVPARIVTPTGDRIDGDIANLTATGVFFRTSTSLQFGQSVTVKMLGQTMPGQVLFVSVDPEGAVLSLRPSEAALPVLMQTAHEVAQVGGPPPEEDDPWGDPNQATVVSLDGEPAKLPTGDLEIVTAEPDAVGIDASLLAAASMDDESAIDIPILDPEIGDEDQTIPPEREVAAVAVPLPRASTPVPPRSGSITRSRTPLPRSPSGLPPPSRGASGAGLPAPVARSASHARPRSTSGVGLPAPSGGAAPARASSGAGLPASKPSAPARASSGVGLPASKPSAPARASSGVGLPASKPSAPARASSGVGLPASKPSAPARASSGVGLPASKPSAPARASSGVGLPGSKPSAPARASSGVGLPAAQASASTSPSDDSSSSSAATLPTTSSSARSTSGARLPAARARGASSAGLSSPAEPSEPAASASEPSPTADASMLDEPMRPEPMAAEEVPMTTSDLAASPPDVIIPPPPVDTSPQSLADDLMSPAVGGAGAWSGDTEVPADDPPEASSDDMLAEPMHPSGDTTDAVSANAPGAMATSEDLPIFRYEAPADEVASTPPEDDEPDFEIDEVSEPVEVAERPESGGLQLVASAAEAPPSADASLPTLDRDGYTVRFASPDAYSVQYAANIEHGGLVVLADALPLGTQRMLALEVPGSAAYTVSARVIYHQDGKLGFMLDSFSIHKTHLKRLAEAI